jgi:hypothetical protein
MWLSVIVVLPEEERFYCLDCETNESDDEDSDAANLDEGLVFLLGRLLRNDQDAPAFRYEGAEASTHIDMLEPQPLFKAYWRRLK